MQTADSESEILYILNVFILREILFVTGLPSVNLVQIKSMYVKVCFFK